MPLVTIQVTRQGTAPGADRTTSEQKAAIHKGVTDVLHNVLGKHPDDTSVIFQEVEMEDWGRGGLPLPAYRASRPPGRADHRWGAKTMPGKTSSTLLSAFGIAYPILQAPMAGMSPPAQAAAVANAGGLGGIAVGAGTADMAIAAIGLLRERSTGPSQVNVFVHRPAVVDTDRERGWIERLRPRLEEHGASPP